MLLLFMIHIVRAFGMEELKLCGEIEVFKRRLKKHIFVKFVIE